MHHVHISTEFLFVLALLCIGLAWVVGWAVTTTRRDRRAAERIWQAPEPSMSMYARREDYDTARRSTPPAGYAAAPIPAQTVVHNSGGGSTDLLTGVMVGSLLSGGHSHHDTTVIHETYVAPSSSYDSGYSYSDSGSSSSSDSSGGFDASF